MADNTTNNSNDDALRRARGRDELPRDVANEAGDDDDDDFRELVTYQSWADVDMLSPRLEDDDIRYETREVSPNPEERSDGVEPRTMIRVMVPRGQFRQARELLEDFEAQRDVTEFEARPRPEPEDIGRDEDMRDPPQPKMKF